MTATKRLMTIGSYQSLFDIIRIKPLATVVQPASNHRYKTVTKEKAGGVTYTPRNLADFVAAKTVEAAQFKNGAGATKLLDPAAGDGQLLLSLLAQLAVQDVGAVEVHGFETDVRALNIATARIQHHFPKVALNLKHGSFLDFVVDEVRPQDKGGLFAKQDDIPSYDLIIANPPYVRTQIIGADHAKSLASQFGLAGRVDLYYAFIVGIAHVLKPGGIAGIIVSNRFMTTKSGSAVRQAIREHFNVHHVWDLGDSRFFDAAVLPAVLVVKKRTGQERRGSTHFTSIYATSDKPTEQTTDVIAALEYHGVVQIADGRIFEVKNGTLDIDASAEALWRVASAASDSWLSTVEANTWRRFGDIGKIRVGVKTCADRVFIRTDWDDMPAASRPELLRPLTTHHIARRFRAGSVRNGRQIVTV